MRVGSLVAFVIAAAVAFWMYGRQTASLDSTAGGSGPAIIDTVGVKTDLIAMATAERQELALQGKYVDLAELRAKGMTVPERRGPYTYSAVVSATTFTITATYSGAAAANAPQTMTIGPDMQVKDGKAP